MRFKEIEKSVEKILIDYPASRNSDELLYAILVKHINPLLMEMTFEDVWLGLNRYNLPCFESVSRARRKLQANNDDLQGDERIRKNRELLEDEYRKYARK